MERNITLDYFKIILSILVITIHAQPILEDNGIANWLICNGIARIAVPFFFLVSGYYIGSSFTDRARLKKYFIHTFIIYLAWSILYIPTYIGTIEYRSLITFAFFGYYHLWFLPALLIAITILYLLHKKTSLPFILALGAILYIIGYCMELHNVDYRIFRNGLFIGFPFVALGYYIKTNGLAKRINTNLLVLLSLLSLFVLLFESYHRFSIYLHPNILLSAFILCPSLFILILQKGKKTTASNYISQLSSSIYFIHIAVIFAIKATFTLAPAYNFLIVIAISFIISIFIIRLNKRIKILL